MRLSASQLIAYDACGLRFLYDRSPDYPSRETSAQAFGTVVHHCLHVLERAWSAPVDQLDQAALDQALATFEHFWLPENVGQLTNGKRIEMWLRSHTWAGLNERGPMLIASYADRRAHDDADVLALEYPFEVPVIGTLDPETGQPHTISGFIDKLAVRRYSRKPYLSSDDFKTGKTATYLRHHVQGHVYCYATTRPEFWTGFGADKAQELYEAYAPLARRFRWVSLSDEKQSDSWRGEQDWKRLALMVNAVAKAKANNIYLPTLDGSTCNICDHVDHCGDVPLPDDDHGRPAVLR